MPQPPQPPEQGPQIIISPEEFAGRWANAAVLQRTPHECTLDLIRMGPAFQQGQVVARVSFSPLLLSELAELFGAEWRRYTEEAGIPPESEGTND
jgi:hypothetical protein